MLCYVNVCYVLCFMLLCYVMSCNESGQVQFFQEMLKYYALSDTVTCSVLINKPENPIFVRTSYYLFMYFILFLKLIHD